MPSDSNFWPSFEPVPHPNLSSFAAGSSSEQQTASNPPISRSPTSSIALGTPFRSGGNDTPFTGSRDFRTLLAPADPGAFPPSERLQVINLATSKTEEHDNPDTSWSLDELAATILNESYCRKMSRSTIQRILDEADLKPHKSVYWLNSHDPDFDRKAKEICRLYVDAPSFYQQGRLLICCDEKTGMQILQRKYPTQPARPGVPEKREFEYIRHGTRTLMSSFVVATGEVVWDLGPTRTSVDFVNHIAHVANHFDGMEKFDWVVDNLNTHWSLELCERVCALCDLTFVPEELKTGRERRAFLSDPSHRHVFHYTPIHGSWLNQVELWFSVLSRRFLKRGDFAGPEDFEERLRRFMDHYNGKHAHPYRWTYTGEPLVRDTPWSQTRRQQQRGRSWLGNRPPCWERKMYPPRPYRRKAA